MMTVEGRSRGTLLSVFCLALLLLLLIEPVGCHEAGADAEDKPRDIRPVPEARLRGQNPAQKHHQKKRHDQRQPQLPDVGDIRECLAKILHE